MTTTTDNLAAALRALLDGDLILTRDEDAAEARDALAAYDAERKAPPGAGFRVLWEIDSEAETPEAAAREAWDAMRRPDSTACVFDVRDEAGNVVTVDLAQMDDDLSDGPLAPRLHALAEELRVRAEKAPAAHARSTLHSAVTGLTGLADDVEQSPEDFAEPST